MSILTDYLFKSWSTIQKNSAQQTLYRNILQYTVLGIVNTPGEAGAVLYAVSLLTDELFKSEDQIRSEYFKDQIRRFQRPSLLNGLRYRVFSFKLEPP